jgi:AraC-like DNA-binding protein
MAQIKVRRSRLAWQSVMTSLLGHVSLAGYIRDSRGISLTALRNYENFALVYLLEGSGRMKVASQPVMPCRAGDLLFVYPGIPHGYGPGPGERWSELFVVFNGPVFESWRQHGLLNVNHAKQRLVPISRWLPQLEKVIEPGLPHTVAGMLQRVCRLQQFLADIVQEQAPKPEDVQAPWLEQAMHELVDGPGMAPSDVAEKLGLSYETFRKEFARKTGCPPARYRMQRLIEQAGMLISERNLSNKELAETLGFYDEFHFSRRFREVTGKSPREFRHHDGSATFKKKREKSL